MSEMSSYKRNMNYVTDTVIKRSNMLTFYGWRHWKKISKISKISYCLSMKQHGRHYVLAKRPRGSQTDRHGQCFDSAVQVLTRA